MFKILVKRTTLTKAPQDIVYDVNQDWTHFSHLHRKVIVKHHLLFKSGDRQVFLYKARRLYPLPFYDDYIVFREDRPAQRGFRHVYVNAKSGGVHTLDAKLKSEGDWTWVEAEHFFSLPSYWHFLPKFFLRIFLWIYRWRMDKVFDEDNEWIYELMTKKNLPSTNVCAPVVPENYDVLDKYFEKKASELADAQFEYRVSESFDGKGRLRLKKGAGV